MNNLYSIYFQRPPSENPNTYPAGVRLQDGSFIAGTVEGGSEETLFLSHHRLGLLEIPIDVMESDLNSKLKTESFPASAINGDNVLNTLKMISKLTLKELKDNL